MRSSSWRTNSDRTSCETEPEGSKDQTSHADHPDDLRLQTCSRSRTLWRNSHEIRGTVDSLFSINSLPVLMGSEFVISLGAANS